ncbi:MAG: 50S ribosomal protein L24 [bacterium]
MHIKKGDQVLVIAGNEKGKTGKVLKVFPKQNRAIIEGINFRKKALRPTQENPQGGIVEREMPIHASNVMVIDPTTGEGVRTRTKEVQGQDGKTRRVRVSVKSGEMVRGES